ncbi:MAG: lysylphosphatidylglycerol synthase transmembrane domain-containing protein [Gaiellaceae bacterium]
MSARRGSWLRLGFLGLGIVIVVVCFAFALPRIADYGSVWEVLRDLSGLDLALLTGAAILNVLTFAPPWMAVLPGLGFPRALALTQASTALTYIAPGGAAPGIALSYGVLRRWGFTRSRVAVALTVVSVWSQLVILTFPALAVGLLALEGREHAALQTAAVVALVVLAGLVGSFFVGLHSHRQALRVGDLAARAVSSALRLARRAPTTWSGESFARFRGDAIGLLGRRWHVLTAAALAGHLTVFVVLVASLHATGVTNDEVGGIEAFASWSLVRLLGTIPITPGGIGVVELGLTGALVGFGGNEAEVVAAVLCYRALTLLPTLLLGLVAASTWRLHDRRGGEV